MILIYTGLPLIISLIIVHLIFVIALSVKSLLINKRITLHKVPGLPLFLLAITLLQSHLVFFQDRTP